MWINTIQNSANYYVTIQPNHLINLHGAEISVRNIKCEQIYESLITDKIRLPQGLLRWRDEIDITDSDIKSAFISAKLCTSNIFDQVFQYKVLTKILPTNKYLKQYRIIDSDLCSRCNQGQDTVLHAIMNCQSLVPYISQIFEFLQVECDVRKQFTTKGYILGFAGDEGLNFILLQLKKYFFYNKDLDLNIRTFREHFLSNIRKLMIKEKSTMIANEKCGDFVGKWRQFSAIYDFWGPDLQIVE